MLFSDELGGLLGLTNLIPYCTNANSIQGLLGLTNLIPYCTNANSIQGKIYKITGPSAYRLVVSHPIRSLIIDATQYSVNDEYTQNNFIYKNGSGGTEISIYKDDKGKLYFYGKNAGGTKLSIIPLTNDNPIILEPVISTSDLELIF